MQQQRFEVPRGYLLYIVDRFKYLTHNIKQF